MTVTPLAPVLPLAPDAPLGPVAPLGTPPDATPLGGAASGAGDFAAALARAFGEARSTLVRADAAEHAFVAGRGGLQEAALERAQADVALSIAATAASRTAQALTTLLGLQL